MPSSTRIDTTRRYYSKAAGAQNCPANDRTTMAAIGCGGQGTGDIRYVGTEGELDRGKPKPPKPSDMPSYQGRGGIFGDFLHCVRTREKPFRDIEVAHRACTVCHLGNTAYGLNRPLNWDPEKEAIVGDAEAARRLDRPKREPWALS